MRRNEWATERAEKIDKILYARSRNVRKKNLNTKPCVFYFSSEKRQHRACLCHRISMEWRRKKWAKEVSQLIKCIDIDESQWADHCGNLKKYYICAYTLRTACRVAEFIWSAWWEIEWAILKKCASTTPILRVSMLEQILSEGLPETGHVSYLCQNILHNNRRR